MFFHITFEQIELEGCGTSQKTDFFKSFSDLSYFLKIQSYLARSRPCKVLFSSSLVCNFYHKCHIMKTIFFFKKGSVNYFQMVTDDLLCMNRH